MGVLKDESDMVGKRRNAINIRDKEERWIGGRGCGKKSGGKIKLQEEQKTRRNQRFDRDCAQEQTAQEGLWVSQRRGSLTFQA